MWCKSSPAKPLGGPQAKVSLEEEETPSPRSWYTLVSPLCSALDPEKPVGGVALAQIQHGFERVAARAFGQLLPAVGGLQVHCHSCLIHCLLMFTAVSRYSFVLPSAMSILTDLFQRSCLTYSSFKQNFNNPKVDKTINQFSSTVGQFWLFSNVFDSILVM